MQTEVKKTPIGEIGKNKRKVTIADEIELETQYHIDPPLTAKQLAECWLDPSEFERGLHTKCKLVAGRNRTEVPKETKELLLQWLKPEALNDGIFRFEEDTHFGWACVRQKVIRKFNLTNLTINSTMNFVRQIKIASRQPLYDQDAHANRVRNLLHAVKVRHPDVFFEHEQCLTSGVCPVGLQEALTRLAEETHGKRINRD